MDFKELLLKNRSYRRFNQAEKIPTTDLREWLTNIRLTPSPANLQPLKFILVNREDQNRQLFPLLKWAAYLKDWPGPAEGERPSAYIVILGNRNLSRFVDLDYGIALQTLLLSAVEKGWGGCVVASCDKKAIRRLFSVDPELEIAMVLALGRPVEKVAIEEIEAGDIKYWRDENRVHHVPKRSLDELIYKVLE